MAVDLPQPGLTHAAPDPASSPPPGLSAGRGGGDGVRIGINGYFLREPWTGMGQHLTHLVGALDAREAGDEQHRLVVPRFGGPPGSPGAIATPSTAAGPLGRRFTAADGWVGPKRLPVQA